MNKTVIIIKPYSEIVIFSDSEKKNNALNKHIQSRKEQEKSGGQ